MNREAKVKEVIVVDHTNFDWNGAATDWET